ncbi:MAG TPA: hypothetical protein VGH05_03845 [Buttiauxella sp.]|jgi:type 1 fimbria pilin
MKLKQLLTSITMFAVSAGVNASDLDHTVTFEGNVVASTCQVAFPSQITFGNHLYSAPSASGSTSVSYKGIDLLSDPVLSNCPAGEQIVMYVEIGQDTAESGVPYKVGLAPTSDWYIDYHTLMSYALVANESGDAFVTKYSPTGSNPTSNVNSLTPILTVFSSEASDSIGSYKSTLQMSFQYN